MSSSKKRLYWVDFLRGLAIIAVVIIHQVPKDCLFAYLIGPFMMPLFFIISGYFLSDRKTYKLFTGGLIDRLIIPWVFLILLLKPNHLIEAFNLFLSSVRGDVAWFMPCLIISTILSFLNLKINYNSLFRQILTSLFLLFLGYILYKENVPNYGMFITATVCQFYMIYGICIRKYMDKSFNLKTYFFIIALLGVIALCILNWHFEIGYIDVHLNKYGNWIYCIILIFIGCFGCIGLTRKIVKRNNIISIIGKHTLLIYLWHGTLIFFIYKFEKNIGLNEYFWANRILASITACLILTLISVFFEKYIPFIIGKGRIVTDFISRYIH